ncbi:MAG: hypothetical protein KDE32_06460 [Novosphingobium sp.]|nr:hypothetical protein [Novosphingobium sp.]
MRKLSALTLACLVAGCHAGGDAGLPGDSNDHAPFAGISTDETIHFTGTEPFWGGKMQGDEFVYTTPENPEGTAIAVKRFNGRAGLGLSGQLDGKSFDLTVTQGKCSDGMSDRTYPFTATLLVGGETRMGCAWTS